MNKRMMDSVLRASRSAASADVQKFLEPDRTIGQEVTHARPARS